MKIFYLSNFHKVSLVVAVGGLGCLVISRKSAIFNSGNLVAMEACLTNSSLKACWDRLKVIFSPVIGCSNTVVATPGIGYFTTYIYYETLEKLSY